MTRIIKRYANRKLYDTKQSSYVTLDQIQTMVEQGEDLRILDNKTKEDITNPTLAQIIFEREKAKEKVLPLSTLRAIIQSGEDFAQRLHSPLTQTKNEIKAHAEKLEDEERDGVKEFLQSTLSSLDDMRQNIELCLQNTVDEMNHIPALERDLAAMALRLGSVEKSLKRIERLLKSQNETDLSGVSHDPHQNLPQ